MFDKLLRLAWNYIERELKYRQRMDTTQCVHYLMWYIKSRLLTLFPGIHGISVRSLAKTFSRGHIQRVSAQPRALDGRNLGSYHSAPPPQNMLDVAQSGLRSRTHTAALPLHILNLQEIIRLVFCFNLHRKYRRFLLQTLSRTVAPCSAPCLEALDVAQNFSHGHTHPISLPLQPSTTHRTYWLGRCYQRSSPLYGFRFKK